MTNLELMQEIAAAAGYTISGTTGQDVTNKTRAQRRLNIVKADIISRYGGRWPSQYREGWLPLQPLYNTGTLSATIGSTDVLGSGTTWNSANGVVAGAKIKMPDGSYYRIGAILSTTELLLATPYQGVTVSGSSSYQIWQDEYKVYPEVLSIGGFIDYQIQDVMTEAWPRNMKQSYPYPVNVEIPTVYTVIGRAIGSDNTFNTGTLTGTINTNTLSLSGSGNGFGFLGQLAGGGLGGPVVEPGMTVTLNGTDNYHIRSVSSTSITLYQNLKTTYSATSYTIQGFNPLIVRFREPVTQRVVHYWYWAKSYPLINDNDQDWICEIYPEVIQLGAVVKDYIDKNDVARANMSKVTYENAIKDMKVAEDGAMTGVRTLAYDLPPESRD